MSAGDIALQLLGMRDAYALEHGLDPKDLGFCDQFHGLVHYDLRGGVQIARLEGDHYVPISGVPRGPAL